MKAFEDDVHGVADGCQLDFTFDGTGHVKSKIEGHQLERSLLEFAIVSYGHDVIEAIDRDALPIALLTHFAQPLTRNIRPDVFANPRFGFVADPAGFARKHEHRIGVQRKHDVHVAVNDFKAGHVAHGAFKSGVLVATDNQAVHFFSQHGFANVVVAAGDFFRCDHEIEILSALPWGPPALPISPPATADILA